MRYFMMIWSVCLLAMAPVVVAEAYMPEPVATPLQRARYWINSNSGKTHNSGCRYYYNCKGYPSDRPSGNNCKLCGGARG